MDNHSSCTSFEQTAVMPGDLDDGVIEAHLDDIDLVSKLLEGSENDNDIFDKYNSS